MTISQWSMHGRFAVEFTQGYDPEIPDDKAKSRISEWIVTAFLSFSVIKSPPQGITIKGNNLIHLDAHDMA